MTMTPEEKLATALQLAEKVVSAANIVSHDGYYELDIDAVTVVLSEAIERMQERVRAETERLDRLLNTPEVEDFARGVGLEAAHQRERWGVDRDAGKTPFDWFWLIGYLAQKAADAAVRGDVSKAKHHTISTAAALANWHLALLGADNRMRPGIDPPAAIRETPHAEG